MQREPAGARAAAVGAEVFVQQRAILRPVDGAGAPCRPTAGPDVSEADLMQSALHSDPLVTMVVARGM